MNEPKKTYTPMDITGFWLGLDEAQYWQKDDAFDAELTQKFGNVLKVARAGELDHWCDDQHGVLALTLILDQFNRNILRGTPQMFDTDEHARTVANYAMRTDIIEKFDEDERRWFIMPFMHSEDFRNQRFCVAMCKRYGLNKTIAHAMEHRDIIKEFGRFPHRNKVLGRESTPQELEFLSNGGFAG